MIGGILGGSAAARLGSALRHLELEAVGGRRLLVVGALPKVFPVSEILPETLAPGYANNRPVDVLAESYATVRGEAPAAAFFTAAALASQGGGMHRNSNDAYWYESMRSGLSALFRIAGVLACRPGERRSLVRILCDCFDDLHDAIVRVPSNGTPERPQWLDSVPVEMQRPVLLNYLGKSSPSTFSHLSTLAVAVEELRGSAPRERTAPFAAKRDGAPLFLYAPAWGNAPFSILLEICMRSSCSLFLPEVHLWPESELNRVGHALSRGARECGVVWTSLFAPPHPAFESDWEIFCRTSSSDVLGLFRARLNRYGTEGETRLKELKYETPAALDDEHALLRSPSGWRIVDCPLYDERRTVALERGEGVALSEEAIFAENMAELAAASVGFMECGQAEESPKERGKAVPQEARTRNSPRGRSEPSEASPEPAASRLGRSAVRIVEGTSGDTPGTRFGYWMLNGERLRIRGVPPEKKEYLALLGKEEGEPQTPLAFYEKLWTAPAGGREISGPRVDAFVPLVVDPGRRTPENGAFAAFAPRCERVVRLLCRGLNELPEAPLVAFGTWIEPRGVLLVRSLLKPLDVPSPVSTVPRRSATPLSGRWKAVRKSGEMLRAFLKKTLEGLSSPSALPPEAREELVRLRSEHERNASLAMDMLHKEGKPLKHLENRGFVGMNMEPLAAGGDPWEAQCAADLSGLPPADYRARLKLRGAGERRVRAFDAVFASLLLNLEIGGIEEGPVRP